MTFNPGRTGFRSARRPRRDRHECRPLRLRARRIAGNGSWSIAAWASAARSICRASTWSIPTCASSRRSGRTCSASSSPTRTRIISARWSRCGPGCARPSMPPVRRRPPRDPPPVRARRAEDRPPGDRRPGQRLKLGPFDIEYIPVAHSIPESNALAIRTPHRPRRPYRRLEDRRHAVSRQPDVGGNLPWPRRRGRAGLDLQFHQRRARRHKPERGGRGASPGRADQGCAAPRRRHHLRVERRAHARPWRRRRGECGREVVMVGRAMDRVVECRAASAAISTAFRSSARPTPSAICRATRSWRCSPARQGEPRAALARIAQDEHPDIALSPGDRVIFSSRTIPGQREGGRRHHQQPDRTGHRGHHRPHGAGPRLRAIRAAGSWPRCTSGRGRALPSRPMARRCIWPSMRNFAHSLGVPEVVRARNGSMVRLAPGPAEDHRHHVPVGRLYKDGNIVIETGDRAVPERRKLAFAGIVSVAIAIDEQGEIAGDPVIETMGLPAKNRKGEDLDGHHRGCGGRSARRPLESEAPGSRGRRERRSACGPRRRQRGLGQEARLSRTRARGMRGGSSSFGRDQEHDRASQPRGHRGARSRGGNRASTGTRWAPSLRA